MGSILNFLIYFFRATPEGKDIVKYGNTHIILMLIAFFGAILIYCFRKSLKYKYKFILKIFVVFLFLQQLVLYCWYVFSGAFSWKVSLPLYDCRVAILCLIFGVFFNSDRLKRIGIYLGFIGSIIALITPELDRFIFPHYTWFSFFVGHIMLLWVSCYIFFVQEIEISFEKYKEVFIFTNLLHIIILFVNRIIHANYAYLTKPPIFESVAQEIPHSLYVFIMLLNFNIILFFVHFYFIGSRNKKFKIKKINMKKFRIKKFNKKNLKK